MEDIRTAEFESSQKRKKVRNRKLGSRSGQNKNECTRIHQPNEQKAAEGKKGQLQVVAAIRKKKKNKAKRTNTRLPPHRKKKALSQPAQRKLKSHNIGNDKNNEGPRKSAPQHGEKL